MKNSASQGISLIPKPTSLNKITTGTNIAAVEPYHHVPSAKSCHNQYGGPVIQQELKQPHRMLGSANGIVNASTMGGGTMIYQQQQQHPSVSQRSHYPYPMMQQNQKDMRLHSSDDHRIPIFGSPATEEEKRASQENVPGEHKLEDRLHEFWPNKFDPKYQTLPSGTKFSPVTNNVSRYDCRRPAEGIETNLSGNHEVVANQSKFNSSDKGIADDSNKFSSGGNVDGVETNDSNASNSTYSTNVENVRSANGANVNQQHQPFTQQMNIVRSMPIPNNSNKGLATALPNSNQSSKNADNANR